jgi:GTP:adenosylcobinamide-phosphate guanylyltransferase
MKAEIKFIKSKDFIKTTASGELNLEESKKVMKEIANLNSAQNSHDLLIDIRDTTSILTLSDIYELVLEINKYRNAFKEKIAVLLGPNHDFDKAKFLELVASNRGYNVNTFDDFEKAVQWLMC